MTSGSKPTVERLREALTFDSRSGVFTWVRPPKKATRVRAGDVAGCFDGRYVYICLDGVRFSAHRAAIAYTTGAWPTAPMIDHRDGDGRNNRPGNLREASGSVNQQNQRKAQSRNATGLLGVVYLPNRCSPRKYRAQIWHSGTAHNLGYFLTASEAHAKYLAAKRKTHEGCTL